jgi:tryptophan halogenase
VPYTRAIAHEAGWRWRIPLQHRVGNGLVYSSRYMSDDEAASKLLREVDGRTLIQPRVIRFKPGRRNQVWNKNVVALGLASGFVEPLESTSIHLIMTGLTRLLHLFPFAGIRPSVVEHYNRLSRAELEAIRDFIVLHYHVNERDDSPFWADCRTMSIPDSLAHRIALFKEQAYAYQADGELFRVDSWTQVMLGQGIVPEHYHQVTRTMSDQELRQVLGSMRSAINQAVERLPHHQDFIERYCKAAPA